MSLKARQGIWVSLPTLKPLGFTGWASDGTQQSEWPPRGIDQVQGSGHIGLHSDQVGVTSMSCPLAPGKSVWDSLKLVDLKGLFRKLPRDSNSLTLSLQLTIHPITPRAPPKCSTVSEHRNRIWWTILRNQQQQINFCGPMMPNNLPPSESRHL